MDLLGNGLMSLEALAPALVLICLIVLIYAVKSLLMDFVKILKGLYPKPEEKPIPILEEDEISLKIAKEREALKHLRRKIEGED